MGDPTDQVNGTLVTKGAVVRVGDDMPVDRGLVIDAGRE
jgi:hypothetical protein